MTAVKIIPTKLKGVVQVPPSKSLAHRAIICASLAKGVSRIDNIEYSKDIQATIKAMKSLGTIIEEFENYLIIDGTTTFTKQNSEIDCEESGSTLRFMVPISIVEENKVHFVGRGNLGKRPLDTFYEIFERQNIGYMYVAQRCFRLICNWEVKTRSLYYSWKYLISVYNWIIICFTIIERRFNN